MGRLFIESLNGPKIFKCKCCKVDSASHDDIISKDFQGRYGRAYLFKNVYALSPFLLLFSIPFSLFFHLTLILSLILNFLRLGFSFCPFPHHFSTWISGDSEILFVTYKHPTMYSSPYFSSHMLASNSRSIWNCMFDVSGLNYRLAVG